MSYRTYGPPSPLLVGLDPFYDVAADHLARLIEFVVEETVSAKPHPFGPGQRPFDPRLCVKVLMLGYATGVRSSRALERLCEESLPYRLLTRGDTPSYRTLCFARINLAEELEAAFVGLFAIAEELGLRRMGRLTVDATKIRANASPEAVVRADEYEAVRAELARILAEAEAVDAREGDGDAREGDGDARPPGSRLGKPAEAVDADPATREQMRDILRRVRKAGKQRSPPDGPVSDGPVSDGPVSDGPVSRPHCTPRMLARIASAVDAVDEAVRAERKHLCLTDPDARMMAEGREKQVRECHSFEAAVDEGLLVVGQGTQESNDNRRLPKIIALAEECEPAGVLAITADSGYYAGDVIASLIERGIDLCVPDSHTACDLRRGVPVGTTRRSFLKRSDLKSAGFTYDEAADSFTCAEGHPLTFRQERDVSGQHVRVYVAEADCQACCRAHECLLQANAKHRTLKVGKALAGLETDRQRFCEPAHQERYRHRGEEVETVFAVLRSALGYTRWFLRGAEQVGHEARLFKLGYQLRKVHNVLCAR